MLALVRRQCNPAGRRNAKVLQRLVSYVQGQSPFPNSREYFYYIDHQGQVYIVPLFFFLPLLIWNLAWMNDIFFLGGDMTCLG